MTECTGNHFILNGEIYSTALFDNSLVYEGESVYEVLRMVKGLPVFFFDHLERLEKSAKLQRKPLLANSDKLKQDILLLTETEKKKDINLKIVFNYNRNSNNYLVYFIEPIYPTSGQYEKGVRGVLFHAERKNPESKVINHRLRSAIYHKLILEGAYEALLVDQNNCITEGSRSNIFFIRGDKLITAPDKKVLNGITRKHILDICRLNRIDIEFRCVNIEEISDFESVVMTGTSPVVLPFYRIDDLYFSVKNRHIIQLRNMYLVKAEESMRQFATE